MGQLFSSVFNRLFGVKKQMRILMVGLDNAGKTTILFQLKLGETFKTIPTIGFNVETVEHKNISFTIWDCGSQERVRPLWKHYLEGAKGLIFVVDSSDRDQSRIEDAKFHVHDMANDDRLRDAAVLIFANKNDLPNNMTNDELVTKLGLHFLHNKRWHVQSTCAKKGQGLHDGLDWLSKELEMLSK